MEKQDIHKTFRNETSEKCLSLAARTIRIGVQGNETDSVNEMSCSFVTVQIYAFRLTINDALYPREIVAILNKKRSYSEIE